MEVVVVEEDEETETCPQEHHTRSPLATPSSCLMMSTPRGGTMRMTRPIFQGRKVQGSHPAVVEDP